MQVGAGFQIVHRTDHVREPHTLVIGESAGRVNVSLQQYSSVERGTQTRDPQGVAVTHSLGRACGTAQVDLKHDPMQIGIDARECDLCRVGLWRETARELNHVGDRAVIANFVDGWTVDFAIDGDRWTDGWDEDHVPG